MTPNLFDLEAYDYDLPEERIAQNPADPRDSSRLMVLDRRSGAVQHAVFSDLGAFLAPGDLLVLNDTRVIPARLRGVKRSGGRAEILLLKRTGGSWLEWEALLRPSGKIPPGTEVLLPDGTPLRAGERLGDGVRIVRFPAGTDVPTLLASVGETPLPPYITRSTAPSSSYQTVFARRDGSSAAPTASLHFTEELLGRLTEKGLRIGWVTLHVGLGTFRPVKTGDIRAHHMHEEHCVLPGETRDLVADTKGRGGRVIAAGTTVARTLESFAATGALEAGERDTGLFIYPGYRYRVVDGLITNFHLPKSSLLMLVAAFAGYENIMEAYREAVASQYRFFSFGDAMFIRSEHPTDEKGA
ncbi:MAG TPA: tRNA preQ1(34) S-adenosylmethionine ribosyltransferase-isomerase QueA [Synergistaceae bacterium]|nr:tRNA preQ1(34) S-adenosylmethionine ribosyltransferase-isomerase QueA [Synergistaceae bacterium]